MRIILYSLISNKYGKSQAILSLTAIKFYKVFFQFDLRCRVKYDYVKQSVEIGNYREKLATIFFATGLN